MSAHSRSLLLVLRRCVAVGRLTSHTALKPRGGGGGTSLVDGGVVQQRTWSSATRAVCPRSSGVFHPAWTCSQHRFCTKTGPPYEDDYPPLPVYQSDSKPETKEVYIVQVKGIPWSCTTEDLLRFFSDCRIREGANGVHLTVDRLGRPSGRAFIEMEHEEDVCKALEKHRQYIGPRYVEVSEVTNSDAEAILKKAVHAPADDGVVLIRGLPFSSTEDDIITFFSGLDIAENGITMVTDLRGRKSGEAFVQFSSQEAANKALHRDRELIGHRYIEVFPSRREDVQSSRSRNPPYGVVSPRMASAPPSEHTSVPASGSTRPLHYVHMRGLPFQATGEDIVKFFTPLVVSKVLIECGPKGRPSGEADVYFTCHQDALEAMSRDRMNLGQRYIELFLNSAPTVKRGES